MLLLFFIYKTVHYSICALIQKSCSLSSTRLLTNLGTVELLLKKWNLTSLGQVQGEAEYKNDERLRNLSVSSSDFDSLPGTPVVKKEALLSGT